VKRYALALTVVFLAGCGSYDAEPRAYVSAPPPAMASLDRSWSAAVGALGDQGVKITYEDRDAGVIQGSRDGMGVVARVRALFEHWLEWGTNQGFAGGCIFIPASFELDDQPGAARDYLVTTQRDWLDLLATTARRAVEVGDFRPDLDAAQFAHEFNTILLGFNQAHRLMRDPNAANRALYQFERLIKDAAHAPQPA